MGMGERIWHAFATVIRMNDKIERLVHHSVAMNANIEDLTGRLIRLETALEIGLPRRTRRLPAAARRRGDRIAACRLNRPQRPENRLSSFE